MKRQRVTTKGQEFLTLDLKSKVYWVDTYDSTHPRRKRLERSTGETTKTAAVAKAEDMIREWQANRKTDAELAREEEARLEREKAERRRNILFRDVSDEYVATCEASDRDRDTKVKIRSISQKHLRPFFGDYPIRLITPAACEAFFAHFRASRPGELLEDKVKYLNATFAYAYKEHYLDRPLRVDNPDPHRETGRALTEVEQERLFSAALENETDYLRVELGLGHGLRPEEVGGMRYDWIGTDHVVRIPSEATKRRKEAKQFPLRAEAYRLIMDRKGRSGSPWVFPMPKDATRPDLVWRKGWIRLKRRAELDERPREKGGPGRLRYDDLRHTWLTQAAKNLKHQHLKSINVLRQAIETIREAPSKEQILQILTEALLTLNAEKLDYGVPEICAFAQHDIRVFQKKYLHLQPRELTMMPELIQVRSRTLFGVSNEIAAKMR